jgi:hypothetical protein
MGMIKMDLRSSWNILKVFRKMFYSSRDSMATVEEREKKDHSYKMKWLTMESFRASLSQDR